MGRSSTVERGALNAEVAGSRPAVPASAATERLLAGRLTIRVQEAAKLLSLSKSTMWDHIRRGTVRGIRLGKGRRAITLISCDELRRLLNGETR